MPQLATTSEDVGLPTSTMDLDDSERLIVWTLRRWVRGLRQNDGTQWTLVWKEFGRAFNGRDGTIALAGFVRLIDGFQCHARRGMRMHQVCCSCLSADELRLVSLISACQWPEPAAAKARAAWLVHNDGVGALLEAGTQLAKLMRRHGMTLPRRTQAYGKWDGEIPLRSPLTTVH